MRPRSTSPKRSPRSTACSRASPPPEADPLRLLHVHTRFDPLGEAIPTLQLIGALGSGTEHAVVAAATIAPEAMRAAGDQIAFPDDFPRLGGAPLPARLRRIGMAMRGFDLVLTHGAGALDAAMAATLLSKVLALPPVLHHEAMLDAAEAQGPSRRRAWYRRVALGRVAGVIVPSARLEALALGAWQQPAARVRRIGPGADLARLARKVRPDALPRLIKRKGELWLGSVGGLDDESGAVRLVRTLGRLPEAWQLVLVGEGPAREAVRAEALRLEIAHRVHVTGILADPAPALGLFDLFALGGRGETAPELVAAAMAGGLAIVAPDVGDRREWLGQAADAQLCRLGDEAAFAARLAAFAADAPQRRALGEANRLRAARFDLAAALGARRDACAAALGRDRFP